MTDLEKAARAFFADAGLNWDDRTPEMQRTAIKRVRAVLESLMKPSEGALAAGDAVRNAVQPRPFAVVATLQVWQAVARHILDEKP